MNSAGQADMAGNSEDPPKMNTFVSINMPEEYPRGPRGWIMRLRNRNWRQIGDNMKENLLLILLLGSVILGSAVGFGVRNTYGKMTKRELMYLQFPGEILMRMLKMLILPLVVSSLIAGIAGLDASTCGKMGLRTIAYFATTTMSAVILGIIMTYIMGPGTSSDKQRIPRYGSAAQLNPVDTFLDLIRSVYDFYLFLAGVKNSTHSAVEFIKSMADVVKTRHP